MKTSDYPKDATLCRCRYDLNYITTMCVQQVFSQMAESKKKLIGITPEQLVYQVCGHLAEKFADIADNDFNLSSVMVYARDYVWQQVNTREARYIIGKLKTDPAFCYNFFYGKRRGLGPDMLVIAKKILFDINSRYHLCLELDDISTIVYTKIWDEGTWGVFDSFGYRSSIFSWLDTIARREVIKRLEEEHYINVEREKTAGNTRLAMKSCDPDYCRLIIDDNVYDSADRRILQLVYVDGLKDSEAMKTLGMDQAIFEKSLKKAESRLRDAMVRNSDNYDDVLSEKSSRNTDVSLDDVAFQIKDLADSDINTGRTYLAECYGVNIETIDLGDLATNSLLEIERGMGWNERDRDIWRMKFWEKAPTKEISDELGRTVSYIDNRYMQLRQQFGRAARAWAVKRGFITQGEARGIEARILRERQEHSRELAERREREPELNAA